MRETTVLNVVRHNAGKSTAEIAILAGLELDECRSILTDLVRSDRVTSTVDKAKNSRGVTWARWTAKN